MLEDNQSLLTYTQINWEFLLVCLLALTHNSTTENIN